MVISHFVNSKHETYRNNKIEYYLKDYSVNPKRIAKYHVEILPKWF